MPTVQSMELPKPKNWQDFETIVRDAMAQRWKSTTLQKNGRPGQKQHGVDIWGPDEIGRPVGVQCKKYDKKLGIKIVEKEVSNAEEYVGHLSTLFIATTNDYAATLQQEVRLLSDKRVAQGEFAVSILFWDDVVSGLLLNPAVFQAHYPQMQLTLPADIDNERMLAALELGYFGADIWAYILLIYGEFGQLAQTDPDELIAHLRIIERRAQQLFPPSDAEPILDALSKVREGCQTKKTAKSDWDPVEVHAKRASSRIQTASSLLRLGESNVLDLGIQLGKVYHRVDDRPSAQVRNLIKTKITSILSDASENAIQDRFRRASKLNDGYRWASSIYSLMDYEIRYRN